jgi:alkanesulfonate monooxygenase SsuD/methylene tetrahydromethanopterin reductase-like flavin-dependent oxidoreductase (luciferase family)
VVILPEHRWADAASTWRDAEALGFAHAWTYDHLAWRSLRDSPWFAAVPVLAAAAIVTSTMRLGTMVASPNFRHPVPLAREVLALDDISDGRLDLGLGAGAEGWDATMLGHAPWPPAERGERFAEFVELLDRLLTTREVSYTGRFCRADGARSYPGCRQSPRVPFFVAATGQKAMSVVARHGQAWVTTGPRAFDEPVGVKEGVRAVERQLGLLETACHAVGRDGGDLRRVVLTGRALDSGMSSEQRFADVIGSYERIGITDLLVHWPRAQEPFKGERAVFERVIAANREG